MKALASILCVWYSTSSGNSQLRWSHSAMLIMDALLFVECNFVQAYSKIIMENDLRSDHYQILQKLFLRNIKIEVLVVRSVSCSIVFSPSSGLHRRVMELMEGVPSYQKELSATENGSGSHWVG